MHEQKKNHFGLTPLRRLKELPNVITPINNINTYQPRWTIKIRVTAKKEPHHYKTQRGAGHMFNFNVIDSDITKTHVCCFNELASNYYEKVQFCSTYLLSRGTIKPVNKLYNRLNSGLEVTLQESSGLVACEDDNSVPSHTFSFVPPETITTLLDNSVIDAIGVVICVKPTSTIRRENGMEVSRCTIQFLDTTRRPIDLTLWGSGVEQVGSELQQSYYLQDTIVLVVKGGHVTEFNGRVLNTIGNTQLMINVQIPATTELKSWFDDNVKDSGQPSISYAPQPLVVLRMKIHDIHDQTGCSTRAIKCIVKATIIEVNTDKLSYLACPNQVAGKKCKKILSENANEEWYYEKCDKKFTECNYSYMVHLQLQDYEYIARASS